MASQRKPYFEKNSKKLAREVEFRAGYKTCLLLLILPNKKLYEISGHLEHYKDSMFPPMKLSEEEGEEAFYLKTYELSSSSSDFLEHVPRFLSRASSTSLQNMDQVYRYEQSGELAGLLRVRGMCMNDAHIYCTEETTPTRV
jgi:threonyl-tRNA synthetase